MKELFIFIFGLAVCLFVGSAVGSIFTRYKDEPYFLWRNYARYQSGDINLFTLIISAIFNIIIGGIIILLFYIGIS
jgi:hypothetical protein